MRIPSSLRASRAERVVGPLELFYDLAVVVLVAQAAHHLAGHLTWRGLGEFAAVFTLVWIAWANGSLHHELHGHDDARARSTFLLQILVLVAMAAFIPEAGGERGAAFAVAAGVLSAGVLGTTMLVAASLQAWEDKRGLYRPLAGACGGAAVACLGVGAARPTPLVLGLALVLLLSIPWGLAVARRLASGADSPGTPQA